MSRIARRVFRSDSSRATSTASLLALSLSTLASAVASGQSIPTTLVDGGLQQPLFVTYAPGDRENIYVLEKTGDIEVIDMTTGVRRPTPLLNITSNLTTGGERGLLGLAFDPDYQTNGYFYVNLTNGASDTVIRRYTQVNGVATAPMDLLTIDQPQSNHNGGWIGFNPTATGAARNNLYIGMGDGGNFNDTGSGHTSTIGNAQDLSNNLLGKMLRIDVSADDFPSDTTRNYAIPADNPFVNDTGADDEIFAYGLRNPWRNSFDRETGDLWIGDVGQDRREEVDLLPGDSTGGENYGWRLREGNIATPGNGIGGPAPADHVEPVLDYSHGSGTFQGGGSITGGIIYRGPSPLIDQGVYFYNDYLSDDYWGYDTSIAYDPNDPAASLEVYTNRFAPNSGDVDNTAGWGEDYFGNMFITDLIDGDVFVVDMRIPGDANRDGDVNLLDLDLLGANWRAEDAGWDGADFNNDGMTDLLDLDILGGNWGWGVEEPGAFASALAASGVGSLVPEPGTAALAIAGVIVLVRRRRA